MALAFLGTVQTAAHWPPSLEFSPNYLHWYRASLRDKHKKDASTAKEIDASLEAHAKQFSTDNELRAAMSVSKLY
jgi:hypothetical protein